MPARQADIIDRPLCVHTRSWRSSGAGLFAQELVDGLLAVGASVVFVCPPVEAPAFERPRPGLRRLRPPRERGEAASRPARWLASLARIAGDAVALVRARQWCRDYLVTIPDPLPFSIAVMALLRLTGARIVYVVHDPLPHAWKLPGSLRWLERGAIALSYRVATALVVLSEPSRQALRHAFPVVRTPVSVIEHGVFSLGDTPPIPGKGRLLVFGTLRRNKGILEAIGGAGVAHRAGAAVRLIVAGGIHADDRGYAEQCRIAAQELPDVVDLRIGFVEDDALPALFAQCDALLMPYTDFASQSGVAMLAASNARPIIASPAGGIGVLIDEGMPAVTIATPVDVDTVGSAIIRFLAEEPRCWAERADAYRSIVMERRSWPVIARQYLDLIERLGGGRQPDARY